MVTRPPRTLAALLPLLLDAARGATDIPSQLALQYDISLPVEPATFSAQLTKRLNGLNWTDVSAPLQRALLWDAGLIGASPSDAGSAMDTGSSITDTGSSGGGPGGLYLQVYVPCGRTMNDVFLAKDVVARDDDAIQCEVKSCNQDAVNFVTTNCHLNTLEKSTLCGLDETLLAKLATASGPSWSQDGRIDSTFDPAVVHQAGVGRNMSDSRAGQTIVDMFALLEKSSLKLDAASCPSKASFIVPCRTLDMTDATIQRQWCVPEQQLGVQLWVKQFAASLSASSTPSPDVANTGSSSSSSSSSTAAVILGVALGVALVLCIVLFVMLRRKRSGDAEQKDYVAMPATPPFHPNGDNEAISGSGQKAQRGSEPFARPSEAPTVATALSSSVVREIELANEKYRKQSPVLAEFCDDQALMMKRIAFVRLQFLEPIDKGANGEVWRGAYEGQVVAIKRTRTPENGAEQDVQVLEEFAKEIRLASALDHPNVVRFLGLSWRTLADLAMVSEFMPMGDLAHFLDSSEGKQMTWGDEKVAIAVDIANALVYLHSLLPLVIHRDLKSRNVLLDEQLTAKISDFGLSRERSVEETMTSGIGTLLWTAPEVLRGERYDEKADMYSFGVLLTELDTCLPPFSLNPEVQGVRSKGMALVPLITSGQILPAFSPACPPPILELAMQCLDQNAANRPPAMQVVYHLRSKIRPLL